MEIKGKRLKLREINYNDLPKMVSWRNKNRKWFLDQKILTQQDQEKWFKNYLENDLDKMFIIEAKEGTAIGTVGIYNIDYHKREAEFGRLIIGEDVFKGKGMAKEANMLLLKYAFEKLDLIKIYLKVFHDNIKAIELYKRCGFKKKKILPKKHITENGKKNIILMELVTI